MSDGRDLAERIRSMADDLAVPLDDLDRVRHRAGRRRLRVQVASGAVAVILGLAVVAPLRSLVGLGEGAARPGEAPWTETYVLSDFEVEYPLRVRPDPAQSEPRSTMDLGKAGVTFRSDWSGSVYPGEASCEMSVLASDGSVLGSLRFNLATYEPSVTAETLQIEIPVSEGTPKTATGSCGPGTPPSTGRYRFSDLRIEQSRIAPVLAGTVTWATDEPPLDQSCLATFTMQDGGTDTYPFTLAVGPTSELHVLLDDRFAAAIPLRVTCQAFTGEGESTSTSESPKDSAYYVAGARPAEGPNGHVRCVPWSAVASYLRICQDNVPDGFIPGGPPGGIDDYPEVCALALEQWDFDLKGGLPIPANLEDIGPADEEVVEPQSCFVTPMGSYPAQDPARLEFAVSFSLRGSDANTHLRVQAPAGSGPASSMGSVDEACPSGQLIQVNRWEDTVERLREFGDLTRVPNPAAGWPHVDQFVVVPDDPGRFVGEVPDGFVLALNCVPIAGGSALVRMEGDNGSFIPDSNLSR